MKTKSDYINELNSITTKEDWNSRALQIRSEADRSLSENDFLEVHTAFSQNDKKYLDEQVIKQREEEAKALFCRLKSKEIQNNEYSRKNRLFQK